MDENKLSELKANQEHLDDLYVELERRMRRYYRRGYSKVNIDRLLSKLRKQIIDTTVRIWELCGHR